MKYRKVKLEGTEWGLNERPSNKILSGVKSVENLCCKKCNTVGKGRNVNALFYLFSTESKLHAYLTKIFKCVKYVRFTCIDYVFFYL